MRFRILLMFSLLLGESAWASEPTSVDSSQKKALNQEWLVSEENVDEELVSRDINLVPERPSGVKKSGLALEQNWGTLGGDGMAVEKPACDNPVLMERVLENIADYYRKNPKTSIIDQRKQALLLKNLTGFKKVETQNFNQKENYDVADKLIEYKVNKGLTDDNILLCRSVGQNKMYLLLYPENSFYRVELLNFKTQNTYRPLTFVYN